MSRAPVFLDTVGLLALWNRRDQWHGAAQAAFAKLAAARIELVTTSRVLFACGNAAARYPFRSSVLALREQLVAAGKLLEPTRTEIDQAWQAYATSEGGQAGIVDQVLFIVMRREGLMQAFSNDRHFQSAGFETLF